MPALRGRSETRQTPPGARPNRRAQPRSAGGRGALPSPRVGCMSRRATGGPRWMTVAAVRAAAQNSAYRPPRCNSPDAARHRAPEREAPRDAGAVRLWRPARGGPDPALGFATRVAVPATGIRNAQPARPRDTDEAGGSGWRRALLLLSDGAGGRAARRRGGSRRVAPVQWSAVPVSGGASVAWPRAAWCWRARGRVRRRRWGRRRRQRLHGSGDWARLPCPRRPGVGGGWLGLQAPTTTLRLLSRGSPVHLPCVDALRRHAGGRLALVADAGPRSAATRDTRATERARTDVGARARRLLLRPARDGSSCRRGDSVIVAAGRAPAGRRRTGTYPADSARAARTAPIAWHGRESAILRGRRRRSGALGPTSVRRHLIATSGRRWHDQSGAAERSGSVARELLGRYPARRERRGPCARRCVRSGTDRSGPVGDGSADPRARALGAELDPTSPPFARGERRRPRSPSFAAGIFITRNTDSPGGGDRQVAAARQSVASGARRGRSPCPELEIRSGVRYGGERVADAAATSATNA